MNKLEIKLAQKLESMGFSVDNPFVSRAELFVSQFKVGPYILDFADAVSKIGIEANGAYWHGISKNCEADKITERVEKDNKKHNYLREAGWKVVSIWDFELENKPEVVESKILSLFVF